MKSRITCPGCRSVRLSPSWRIPRQPVVLNYRFATPAHALAVPRRDLRLRQCQQCGLIFNAVFEPDIIPYNANYENSQRFSPAFRAHLQAQVRRIRRHLPPRGAHVLEIGCGKGDFLRLLCQQGKAQGIGFDTTYEGPGVTEGGLVHFDRRYVSAADVDKRYDAVVCRHVVEHIGEIGRFLRELRATAAAAGDPTVFLETPTFEWIAAHGAFWDVFYEHCNYFSRPCMAQLCRLAGFKIERQLSVFSGQYQWLELRLRRRKTRPDWQVSIPMRLEVFARSAADSVRALERRLRAGGAERGWAVWGAGAKGVALVNRLPHLVPTLVVDSNAAKQGGFIPGSRVPIVAPSDPRLHDLALVLIANSNYTDEITSTLRQMGFTHTILTT